MKSFTLACFLGFIFLLLASLFVSAAAPAQDKKAKEKPKADVASRSLKFDTGKKDAKGKPVVREFPVMFDIAERSVKHKAKQKKD